MVSAATFSRLTTTLLVLYATVSWALRQVSRVRTRALPNLGRDKCYRSRMSNPSKYSLSSSPVPSTPSASASSSSCSSSSLHAANEIVETFSAAFVGGTVGVMGMAFVVETRKLQDESLDSCPYCMVSWKVVCDEMHLVCFTLTIELA